MNEHADQAVTSLAAKLESLDLTDDERAVLEEVLSRADGEPGEVEGFDAMVAGAAVLQVRLNNIMSLGVSGGTSREFGRTRIRGQESTKG